VPLTLESAPESRWLPPKRRIVPDAAAKSPVEVSALSTSSVPPKRPSVPVETSTERSLSTLAAMSVLAVPDVFFKVPLFSKRVVPPKLVLMSVSSLKSKVPEFSIRAPVPVDMGAPLTIVSPAFSRTRLLVRILPFPPEIVSFPGSSEPLAPEIRVLPPPVIVPPLQVAMPPEGTLSVALPLRVPPEKSSVLVVAGALNSTVAPEMEVVPATS
jgi:hypothetical protein